MDPYRKNFNVIPSHLFGGFLCLKLLYILFLVLIFVDLFLLFDVSLCTI